MQPDCSCSKVILVMCEHVHHNPANFHGRQSLVAEANCLVSTPVSSIPRSEPWISASAYRTYGTVVVGLCIQLINTTQLQPRSQCASTMAWLMLQTDHCAQPEGVFGPEHNPEYSTPTQRRKSVKYLWPIQPGKAYLYRSCWCEREFSRVSGPALSVRAPGAAVSPSVPLNFRYGLHVALMHMLGCLHIQNQSWYQAWSTGADDCISKVTMLAVTTVQANCEAIPQMQFGAGCLGINIHGN